MVQLICLKKHRAWKQSFLLLFFSRREAPMPVQQRKWHKPWHVSHGISVRWRRARREHQCRWPPLTAQLFPSGWGLEWLFQAIRKTHWEIQCEFIYSFCSSTLHTKCRPGLLLQEHLRAVKSSVILWTSSGSHILSHFSNMPAFSQHHTLCFASFISN